MPEFELLTLLALPAASWTLNLTPGADVMFITACGAQGGPRIGAEAGLGVSAGSLVHVALAVAGVAALIEAKPDLFDALRGAGAAYLIWLAIAAWRAEPPEARMGAHEAWRAFRRGRAHQHPEPEGVDLRPRLPAAVRPARGGLRHCADRRSRADLRIRIGPGELRLRACRRAFRRAGRAMNRLSALIFSGLAARLIVN